MEIIASTSFSVLSLHFGGVRTHWLRVFIRRGASHTSRAPRFPARGVAATTARVPADPSEAHPRRSPRVQYRSAETTLASTGEQRSESRKRCEESPPFGSDGHGRPLVPGRARAPGRLLVPGAAPSLRLPGRQGAPGGPAGPRRAVDLQRAVPRGFPTSGAGRATHVRQLLRTSKARPAGVSGVSRASPGWSSTDLLVADEAQRPWLVWRGGDCDEPERRATAGTKGAQNATARSEEHKRSYLVEEKKSAHRLCCRWRKVMDPG